MSTNLTAADDSPVLFLHALGVNSECWSEVRHLLHDFRVLTFNFPGHGGAPMTDIDYGVHELAESVASYIKVSEFDRVHVAGMSMGGLVAQDLAAHHPELVDHLILIDTVAVYPEAIRQQWRDRANIARSSGMDTLVAPTLEAWFSLQAIAEGTPPVLMVGQMIAEVDPEAYAQACSALEHADTRAILTRISAPTLIVCGRDDLPPFIAAVPTFEEEITGATTIWIDPGRHAAALESPETFTDTLRTFLLAGKGH